MPAFSIKCLSAYLTSLSLEGTVSNDVTVGLADDSRTPEIQDVLHKLRNDGKKLSELRLEEQTGPKFVFNNIPLMASLTRSGVFDHNDTVAPSSDTEYNEFPMALVLHTIFSMPFIHQLENKNQMLKIQVFFNGVLTCSTSHKFTTSDDASTTFHLVFAGIRTNYNVEQPFVIMPPSQYQGPGDAIGTVGRWFQISEELWKEVVSRGRDSNGQRSPSASYLSSLATMDIPPAMEELQNLPGRLFGTIDLVVTAGSGTLDGPYISTPTRLEDNRYSTETSYSLVDAGPGSNQNPDNGASATPAILKFPYVGPVTGPLPPKGTYKVSQPATRASGDSVAALINSILNDDSSSSLSSAPSSPTLEASKPSSVALGKRPVEQSSSPSKEMVPTGRATRALRPRNPEANVDCVIQFAEDNFWDGAPVLRMVPVGRGGEFREEEVLVGMRWFVLE